MKELFDNISVLDFSEKQYTYNENRNEREIDYRFGLDITYSAYNNDKKKDFIFTKNGFMSYKNIEQYYKELAVKFSKIQIDEKKLGGMPVICNTRIPVSLILACLRDEMSFKEICNEYRVKFEDIEEAIEYVIQILDTPYQEEIE